MMHIINEAEKQLKNWLLSSWKKLNKKIHILLKTMMCQNIPGTV